MKIAVLYQALEPPIINGIRKPMKNGGYSDSGADIAYCLKTNKMKVITPIQTPDVYKDYDWVFPDTKEGIQNAINKGADTFWLNTVLYENHPIEKFKNIKLIGQLPSDVSKYDDKFYVNSILKKNGLPVVDEKIIDLNTEYTGNFPCVLKPIRGRGSQGVFKCSDKNELNNFVKKEIQQKIFGTKLMIDEYLSGKEITVSVMPNGKALPIVERFNHNNGIAPYNGDVPVIQNSKAVDCEDKEQSIIRKQCEKAYSILNLKGLIRIDCRADKTGKYKIFDVNLKPNMTGASRPHRMNQNSLTMIAAEAAGWSYYDLLMQLINNRY